jgi:hypothetical protein
MNLKGRTLLYTSSTSAAHDATGREGCIFFDALFRCAGKRSGAKRTARRTKRSGPGPLSPLRRAHCPRWTRVKYATLSAPATMVRSLQSTYVGNFVCAPTMHNVR